MISCQTRNGFAITIASSIVYSTYTMPIHLIDCMRNVHGYAVSVLLGIGRSAYAKRGKRIGKVLLLCAIGSVFCYLVAALSSVPLIGLIACALTGLCTSMLWPGNLIAATERFPTAGVFLYALMAAGGDLGASVAPQLVGIITDGVIASSKLSAFAGQLGLAPDQLGMKLGMLVGMLFPLAAVFVILRIRKDRIQRGLEK